MNGNLENFDDACETLREKLRRAVQRKTFDGAFLSGGLDTSVINHVAREEKSNFHSVSVGFEESEPEDLKYSETVADELGIENHVRVFSFAEAKESAEEVVRIMESFDPIEIRNDIPLYIGLMKAKELGLKSVLTGDGSDELLAGYTFLYELPPEEMKKKLEKIWKNMSFSSRKIGEKLDVNVELPFLDEDFRKFAVDLEPKLKVGEKAGKRYGKWILRKAYQDKLPREITWREKTPIETGTGTANLPEKFKTVTDKDRFKKEQRKVKEEDGVSIGSEEQLFYYKIYRSLFNPPKNEHAEGKQCPYCRSGIPDDAEFCRTCGSAPTPRKR